MASDLNHFNSVSSIYDRVASFVFGTTLHDAQCHFIRRIPTRSKVLILGGGTGKFLKELLDRRQDVTVTYVDASSKMIALSKRIVANDSRVTFIHGTQDSIPEILKVNVVVTSFYLDLFSNQSLNKIVDRTRNVLVENGIWIATDFTHSKRASHRFLLWLMYRFFRLATGIESKELPAWEHCLSKFGKEIDSKVYENGFIKTALYKINA